MKIFHRFCGIGAISIVAVGLMLTTAWADPANTVHLSLKNHLFSPPEVTAQAGQPITIVVTNLDSTPAEFESKTLRVEKVVPGGGTISLQIRPLNAGRYRFFDDFHEDTTEGFLVVR